MGDSKFKLSKHDEYQFLQAVDLSVQLIVAGEAGQSGPYAIGFEINDAKEWDDVAIFSWCNGQEEVEYWQIKDQRRNFKEESLKKALVGARDLLLKNPRCSFKLGLPAIGQLEVGDNHKLYLCHLKELCADCRGGGNPHLAIAANPACLQREYLRNWFDFVCTAIGDRVTAANVLRCMKIEELGSHDSIIERTEKTLSQWYREISAAREAIERVRRNANPNSRIRYEDLASELQIVPRADGFPKWTQFSLQDLIWYQRGAFTGADTVANLWELGGRAEIRLFAPASITDPMIGSLLRLSLHSGHGVPVACVDRDGWRDIANHLTGGTLGDDEHNRVDAIFPKSCERSLPPPLPPVNGQTQQTRSLRDTLDDQMDDVTWKGVSKLVDSRLSNLSTDQSFNMEIRTAWQEVKNYIEPPVTGRIILHKFLRVRFEPQNIRGEIRCGPRTTEAMAQVLVLCVVLRVAFREKFTIVNEVLQIDDIPVTAIALKKCRDPDDKHVVPILEHIDKIAFSGGVLLMGGLEMPSESIVCALQVTSGDSFAESSAPSFVSDARVPDVIVSWGRDLQVALGMGKAALFKWLYNRVSRAHDCHHEKLTNILNAIHTEES